jgi:hypothetical protein
MTATLYEENLIGNWRGPRTAVARRLIEDWLHGR